ncbi:MAG: hypothetical protein AAF567_15655 [Actinomycetota bacterium]
MRKFFAKLGLMRILQLVHLLLAVLYLLFALFGKWAKRGDPDEGVFSADGGSGFGIVAVLLAVALLVLAVMRLMGRTRVLPGLGVEQLTVILGIAAWMNMIAFFVGWLATFEAGTGWGVVAAYFPASIIPQVGLLTLSAAEPDGAVQPADAGRTRVISILAAAAGAGVALFPFLTWITDGSVSLSAMDERSGNPLSGPRFGYILLICGAIVFVAAIMRLRPRGLAEPGPNALLGHALIAAGAVAVVIPISTWISAVRLPLELSGGAGLYLGLLAGLAMIVLGYLENRSRGSVGA